MSESMIRCPVCGGTTPASWRYGFGADQVYVCRECGKRVRAELVETQSGGRVSLGLGPADRSYD